MSSETFPATRTIQSSLQERQRNSRLFILWILLISIVTFLFVLLFWLSPWQTPTYWSIQLLGKESRLPWANEDRSSMLETGLWTNTNVLPPNPSRDEIRLHLKTLSKTTKSTPVVFHVEGAVCLGPEGEPLLLPSNEVADHPRNRLPLIEVMNALRECRARNKLLILQLTPVCEDARDPIEAVITLVNEYQDDRTLCLLSSCIGQTPQSSPDLKRTVFGHYLFEGLYGDADGWNAEKVIDKVVTAEELANFVRTKVERWCANNLALKQTPILLGNGENFILRKVNADERSGVESELQPDPKELGEVWQTFDQTLAQGMDRKSPHALARFAQALIRNEENWLQSGSIDQLKSSIAAAVSNFQFESIRESATLGPAHPISIAAIRSDFKSADLKTTRDDLNATFVRVENQTVSPEKAKEMVGKLPPEFEVFQAKPYDLLSVITLDLILNDPSTDQRRFIWMSQILQRKESVPKFVEIDLIQRIAEILQNRSSSRLLYSQALRLIKLVSSIEASAFIPDAYPWVSRILDESQQLRMAAEVHFFGQGFVSEAQCERRIASAEKVASRLNDIVNQFVSASALLHAAEFLDIAINPIRDRDVILQTEIDLLQTRLKKLQSSLRSSSEVQTEVSLIQAMNNWQVYSLSLNESLEKVRRPFQSQYIERAASDLDRAQIADQHLLLLNSYLATPLMAAADRTKLRQARTKFWFRRYQASIEDDINERWNIRSRLLTAEWMNPCQYEASDANWKRSISIPVNAPDVTKNHRAKLLWGWNAKRFEMIPPNQGVYSIFASQAAAEFRLVSEPSPNAAILEIKQESVSPVNRSSQSLLTDLRLRNSHPTKPISARIQFQTPNPEWVEAPANMSIELLPLQEKLISVPLQIGAKPFLHDDKRGLLLEAKVADQTYWKTLPIDLGLLTTRFELLMQQSPETLPQLLDEIRLRPNGSIVSYQFHLANKSTKDQNVIVRWKDVNREVALSVAGNQTVPIKFSAPPQAAPLPMQSAVPDFNVIPNRLSLEILDSKSRDLIQSLNVPIHVMNPFEYLLVDEVSLQSSPNQKSNRLMARIRASSLPSTDPCIIDLNLSEELNPGISVQNKKTRGILSPESKVVTMYADDIGFAEGLVGSLHLTLDVDGYARAFSFKGLAIPRESSSLLRPSNDPLVRIRTEKIASTKQPLPVQIETTNAPPGTTIRVALGLLKEGKFQEDLFRSFSTPRNEAVSVKFDPKGELQFKAKVTDHEIKLPVDQIAGRRILRATLLGPQGDPISSDEEEITLDEQGPANVRFIDAPLRVNQGKPLTLKATCDPSFSGIEKVRMYYGEPMNDAPPPTATPILAELISARSFVWQATLPQTDAKRQTTVTVEFTSKAKQVKTRSIRLELLDPIEAAQSEFGRISGVVTEGDRAQGELPVQLYDEKGVAKAQTKTDEKGKYEFINVPPGKYRLVGRKISTNRSATNQIEVKPGQSVSVTLALLLN
jgi:hypothetical protein